MKHLNVDIANGTTDCLRAEIRESEKIRNDFLKYKLVTIAVLGAVGIGLKGDSRLGGNIDYIFALIPLACIYVDLICFHNNIRIMAIARFLRKEEDAYERFINKLNTKVLPLFKLEDLVLYYTTFLTELLLIGYGIWNYLLGFNPCKACVFSAIGIAGLVLTATSMFKYKYMLERVTAGK